MPTRPNLKTLLLSCGAALSVSIALNAAHAADMPAPPPPPVVPALPTLGFFDGVEYHAQFEGGILGNSSNPQNGLDGKGINLGHLYTDHANEPQLNQVLLTITKAVDPKATGYAFGFTGQALYGSDARFNHFLGIDNFTLENDRNQIALLQAFVAAHLPWFTAGGVDVKAGLFSSPQGYETLDPSTSPFYSHSYTYNYAVTFNHTGILTTTHINPTLDLYLGIDTGNQDTFGGTGVGRPLGNYGDPNGQPAGFVGFGLNNLLDNKLTVLALSHIGPEQAPNADPLGYKNDLRFYNDVVFTYKINDDWTAVLEGNYTKDEFGYGPAAGGPAEYYSGVGYLTYTFDKIYTLGARGEIARDTKNFFVSTPLLNNGIALGEEGFPGPSVGGLPGFGTTYGAATLGLTIKPDVPKPLALVMIRPEIRYDRILDGANLYGGTPFSPAKRDQFTFGGDVVVGF